RLRLRDATLCFRACLRLRLRDQTFCLRARLRLRLRHATFRFQAGRAFDFAESSRHLCPLETLRRVAELLCQGLARPGEELPDDGRRVLTAVDLLDEPPHVGGQAAANPDDTQSMSVEEGEAWIPGRDLCPVAPHAE